ncbi:FAD/FMN-containing dehydrogenase [Azospirillum sp. OGB3]|uniref:FAD-binding oxidoreductase n=1 Tax=Azospirillum sp. OGB3 TaxID=2587012 RepID=UPI001605A9B1|nr:FAD-binding oxidoreductase [Azospirillum sp. OGB3]MBB3264966.1 FAD/FMN-containing dehydrogenase [Azospirillum sp. OGB3]
MRDPQALLTSLRTLLGERHVVTRATDLEPLTRDWRGRYQGTALCAVYPADTEQVAATVLLVREHGGKIVPQGGNTGMCGGATPFSEETVVLRLDRLNRVRQVSALDNTMTVEAGCILADLQARAQEAGRLLPLSLGAEGSCQIGGNIATNAGGTAVLRYGPMRDMVLGLEVVLPDGSVMNDLKRLRKDNSGYAVRHLFIGAEGTLGIVTAAVLKLFPQPQASATAMAGAGHLDQALELLASVRSRLGDRVSAYEVMSHSQMQLVLDHIPGCTLPFAEPHRWYVLIEAEDSFAAMDLASILEDCLADALERGLVADVVIPKSGAQREALWRLRHSVSEANKVSGISVSYDTVVPLDGLGDFAAETERGVRAAFPQARLLFVGHVGDGNLHAVIHFDHDAFPSRADFETAAGRINEIVDSATLACDGSISAEHGIGFSNRKRLANSIDPARYRLMTQIKALLDPDHMMNPGKVLVFEDPQ